MNIIQSSTEQSNNLGHILGCNSITKLANSNTYIYYTIKDVYTDENVRSIYPAIYRYNSDSGTKDLIWGTDVDTQTNKYEIINKTNGVIPNTILPIAIASNQNDQILVLFGRLWEDDLEYAATYYNFDGVGSIFVGIIEDSNIVIYKIVEPKVADGFTFKSLTCTTSGTFVATYSDWYRDYSGYFFEIDYESLTAMDNVADTTGTVSPLKHSSAGSQFGVGTEKEYGHTKVTDTVLKQIYEYIDMDAYVQSCMYVNGQYIVAYNYNTFGCTYDFKTWNNIPYTDPDEFSEVAYIDGMFVLTSGDYYKTSTDLVNWSEPIYPSGEFSYDGYNYLELPSSKRICSIFGNYWVLSHEDKIYISSNLQDWVHWESADNCIYLGTIDTFEYSKEYSSIEHWEAYTILFYNPETGQLRFTESWVLPGDGEYTPEELVEYSGELFDRNLTEEIYYLDDSVLSPSDLNRPILHNNKLYIVLSDNNSKVYSVTIEIDSQFDFEDPINITLKTTDPEVYTADYQGITADGRHVFTSFGSIQIFSQDFSSYEYTTFEDREGYYYILNNTIANVSSRIVFVYNDNISDKSNTGISTSPYGVVTYVKQETSSLRSDLDKKANIYHATETFIDDVNNPSNVGYGNYQYGHTKVVDSINPLNITNHIFDYNYPKTSYPDALPITVNNCIYYLNYSGSNIVALQADGSKQYYSVPSRDSLNNRVTWLRLKYMTWRDSSTNEDIHAFVIFADYNIAISYDWCNSWTFVDVGNTTKFTDLVYNYDTNTVILTRYSTSSYYSTDWTKWNLCAELPTADTYTCRLYYLGNGLYATHDSTKICFGTTVTDRTSSNWTTCILNNNQTYDIIGLFSLGDYYYVFTTSTIFAIHTSKLNTCTAISVGELFENCSNITYFVETDNYLYISADNGWIYQAVKENLKSSGFTSQNFVKLYQHSLSDSYSCKGIITNDDSEFVLFYPSYGNSYITIGNTITPDASTAVAVSPTAVARYVNRQFTTLSNTINTITRPNIITIPVADTNEVTISVKSGSVFKTEITTNKSFIIDTPDYDYYEFILFLVNAGSYDITFPDNVVFSNGFEPILTTAGTDVLKFVTIDGGESWFGKQEGQYIH